MTRLILPDLSVTSLVAADYADKAQRGDCFALYGEMGVGKSAFARAFLRALTKDPTMDVPSPTFSLVQVYDTPKGTVMHYDLWRLQNEDRLVELGWEELGACITLIEWPERAGATLPANAHRLSFTFGDEHDMRLLDVSHHTHHA